MRHARLLHAAALCAGLLATTVAQASLVTYTFTEVDDQGQVVWQLRHSLDHFLDPQAFETAAFGLSDMVVDPWGALGFSTLELDSQGFSALPGFVTFNGAYFYGNRFPAFGLHDPGNQFSAVSFDLHVSDRSVGSWRDGNVRLDVTATDDPTPGGSVPEPAGLPLLALGLLAWRTRLAARR